jgi:hypothetical protein
VNLPKRLPCPAVMFTHNVERRSGGGTRRPRRIRRRLLYGAQYRRMLRFERRSSARSTASWPCRMPIARPSRASIPAHRAAGHVVPTGVDTEYFAPQHRRSRQQPHPDLHRLDGLAAERRRDALLLSRRSCRDPRRGSGVDLTIVGRAPTPA